MSSDNIMIVFDLIIAFLGGYLLYGAIKMKVSKEILQFFLAKDDPSRCRDNDGFCAYMYPKTLFFSIVCLGCGILCFLADIKLLPLAEKSGNILGIVMLIIFLAAWLYYSVFIRRAKEKYFKPDFHI